MKDIYCKCRTLLARPGQSCIIAAHNAGLCLYACPLHSLLFLFKFLQAAANYKSDARGSTLTGPHPTGVYTILILASRPHIVFLHGSSHRRITPEIHNARGHDIRSVHQIWRTSRRISQRGRGRQPTRHGMAAMGTVRRARLARAHRPVRL
jgi:hypothetical protein